MLALRKCQPCFDLDFKGVGNKMTIDGGISCEKYGMKELHGKVNFLQIRDFSIAEVG